MEDGKEKEGDIAGKTTKKQGFFADKANQCYYE